MRPLHILLLTLAATLPTTAATAARKPTHTRLEQTQACKWDVFRYCKSAIPNEGRIALCLKSNLPKLNTKCQSMLK